MSLRFLIDENMPRSVALFLKEKGNDVKSIRDSSPGIKDSQIIQISNEEQRIIISRDKDFGFLVFHQKLIPYGVILIRLIDQSKSNIELAVHDIYYEIFSNNLDIANKFLVFDGSNLRIRSI
jgi:predicted nuclease of predicted toxin-antitoxin system